jgi:hypothetical protein
MKGPKMTTQQHTPGRDERGMYWFDCGCHINTIMACRCALHEAAPDLLAACQAVLHDCVTGMFVQAPTATTLVLLRESIAKALPGND